MKKIIISAYIEQYTFKNYNFPVKVRILLLKECWRFFHRHTWIDYGLKYKLYPKQTYSQNITSQNTQQQQPKKKET